MKNNFSIGFRVDSGQNIGEGHISRTITIAKSIQKYTNKIFFYCASLKNNSNFLVIENNFILEQIQIDNSDINFFSRSIDKIIKHSNSFKKLDLLVLDSYFVSPEDEKKLKSHINKIVVIDDQLNRFYESDMIINYNYGIRKKNYYNLCDFKKTQLLLGSKFSPIKFTKSDLITKKNKRTKEVSILISVGGIDQENYILQILKLICYIKYINFHLIILMSEQAKHIKQVSDFLKRRSQSYELVIGKRNVHKYFLKADFAIGGLGLTSVERAIIGLPSIIFSAAQNQIYYLRLYKKIPGTIISSRSEKENKFFFISSIKMICRRLNAYKKKSKHSRNFFDINGSDKIAKQVVKLL